MKNFPEIFFYIGEHFRIGGRVYGNPPLVEYNEESKFSKNFFQNFISIFCKRDYPPLLTDNMTGGQRGDTPTIGTHPPIYPIPPPIMTV